MTTTGLGKFRRQEIQFRAKKKEHTGVVKIDDITERDTGKSFSEALILPLTNPQYDKRLFMRIENCKLRT